MLFCVKPGCFDCLYVCCAAPVQQLKAWQEQAAAQCHLVKGFCTIGHCVYRNICQ